MARDPRRRPTRRCARRGDPRRRAHDPRRRAEVRAAVVGTVHPDGVWPKSRRPAGRRALPDQAARHRARAARRRRGLAGDDDARRRRRVDADAEPRCGRRPAPVRPNAVTDVTGFGLLGHAYETAERSGVRIVLEADGLAALDGRSRGRPRRRADGGDRRNREFAGRITCPRPAVSPMSCGRVALDPQTAGGLLVSLPRERAAARRPSSDARGLFVRRIGRVETGAGVVARLTSGYTRRARRRLRPLPDRALELSSAAVPRRVVVELCADRLDPGATVRLTALRARLRQLARLPARASPSRRRATTRYIEFGNRLVGGITIALTLAARARGPA